MVDLSSRSPENELMDADGIPFADIARLLRELNTINTRLGGHAITCEGVKLLAGKKALVVCEIGCGGGDNLFALHQYYFNKGIACRFIGIDNNPACIAFAQQRYPQLDCQWMCSDYEIADFSKGKPDIIFSSLFCHHFSNAQLTRMLQWLDHNSRTGFFINDLHRNTLAYYLIKVITKFFSKSYLVKNDAAVSVARSFRRKEWKALFDQGALTGYRIYWKWAFRWLVVYRKTQLT